MVKLTLVKGTVDRLPEEQILREEIQLKLQHIFQLYGFRPAKTPILEDWNVLASKYGGGAEILKEMYQLTDQGNRKIALRYDLSVPLARMVGMHPELAKPFKRYEMGECFRDGPIRKGRYREFNQCDIDTIGIKNMIADAEILKMAHHAFSEFDLEVEILVNNRKLLSGILMQVGVPEPLLKATILSIDKLEKIGIKEVKNELRQKGLDDNIVEEIFTFLSVEGDYLEILTALESKITNSLGKEGINELKELYKYLELFSISHDVKLLCTLARGLEIYTSTVFEVFLKDKSILDSALAGGGRYDEIIQKFAGSDDSIPAVGISFGLDTLFDTLRVTTSPKKHITKVYVIPIKTMSEAIKIATEVRSLNIPTEIDMLNRNISKNLAYANKFSIPVVIIVGKRDLARNEVTIKNMITGEENKVPINKVTQAVTKIIK